MKLIQQMMGNSERETGVVHPLRIILRFLTITIPLLCVFGAAVKWHNELVGEPTAFHLFLRAVVLMAVLAVGSFIAYRTAVKASVRAAAKYEKQLRRDVRDD